MNKNSVVSRIYGILFHIALSFTIFQLVCPFYEKLKYFRPDFICLGLLLILFLVILYNNGFKKFRSCFLKILNSNKFLCILCIIYFIYDTVTIFYAQDIHLLIDKYLIWGKISILSICMLFYINQPNKKGKCKEHIDLVIGNLGITSCIISIIAYVGYYTGSFTYYDRIITTIADHNYFSSGVMFGFVGLCYLILFNEKLSRKKKLLLICSCTIVCFPAMFLSGSRRTIILLWIFLVWFGIYGLYYLYSKVGFKQFAKECLFIVFIFFITFSACSIHINAFDKISLERNIKHIEQMSGTAQTDKGIDYYVESISNGSGMTLRYEIWKCTVEWYKELPTIKKVFGGGASYHYDIFNNIDDPKNEYLVEHYKVKDSTERWMYPHNFLLEELMMGGIIKLLIVLLIMIEVLRGSIARIKHKNKEYQVLGLSLYAVLLGNLIMGAKFGLFANRFTWIVIVLDMAIKYMGDIDNKMEVVKEKGI